MYYNVQGKIIGKLITVDREITYSKIVEVLQIVEARTVEKAKDFAVTRTLVDEPPFTTFDWIDDPEVDPLPEDQVMLLLGQPQLPFESIAKELK